jgi:hypothetical protein
VTKDSYLLLLSVFYSWRFPVFVLIQEETLMDGSGETGPDAPDSGLRVHRPAHPRAAQAVGWMPRTQRASS